jgi:hypothetical protein
MKIINTILEKELLQKYNINLKLKKLSSTRDNIFIGINEKNEKYFVKIEDVVYEWYINAIYQISQKINSSANLITNNFILTNNWNFYLKSQTLNTVIILSKFYDIKKCTKNDINFIATSTGLFHKTLKDLKITEIKKSDFYNDYMYGEIPKAQDKNILKEINYFFLNFSPDYNKLKKWIIHNDYHLDNLGIINNKLFITDFEHIKQGPLISDIAVLLLDFWKNKKNYNQFEQVKHIFLKDYQSILKLSNYDIDNIIMFAIRYLYSDYNWFTYWNKLKNQYKNKLSEIRISIDTLCSKIK